QAWRLVAHARPTDDPAPKALACSGWLVRHVPTPPDQRLRRFGERRPVRRTTTAFVTWGSARVAAHGLTALRLLWDNASWPIRQEVRPGLRQPKHKGKRTGPGGRILAWRLPRKSPWLPPMAPQGVHGKRAIVAPNRLRSVQEVRERVYAYDG